MTKSHHSSPSSEMTRPPSLRQALCQENICHSDSHSFQCDHLLIEVAEALEGGEPIVTTGLILQELLQGFAGPRARAQLIQKFAALPMLLPDRQDHIDAAELRNTCRRAGVHMGTIDALLAQLCVRHDLTLLTTDGDFIRASKHCPLRVWKSGN